MSLGQGGEPDIGDPGPFQANTRVVAVIALTVAGVFVILGLTLSVLRALQQRAAERVRAASSLFPVTFRDMRLTHDVHFYLQCIVESCIRSVTPS